MDICPNTKCGIFHDIGIVTSKDDEDYVFETLLC